MPTFCPHFSGKSHPTGVRGLKFPRAGTRSTARHVAPHWGAWIEILSNRQKRWLINKSHPTGVRGLKYPISYTGRSHTRVAPHWGAWIEITAWGRPCSGCWVAPHWGAWIEIIVKNKNRFVTMSHPTGVRGLKSAWNCPRYRRCHSWWQTRRDNRATAKPDVWNCIIGLTVASMRGEP